MKTEQEKFEIYQHNRMLGTKKRIAWGDTKQEALEQLAEAVGNSFYAFSNASQERLDELVWEKLGVHPLNTDGLNCNEELERREATNEEIFKKLPPAIEQLLSPENILDTLNIIEDDDYYQLIEND
jgi:hypothetical protein